MKSIPIIHRNLGREGAAGLAWNEKKDKKFGTIEIDPRIEKHGSNRWYMDTMIHEALHMIKPKMTENDVARTATKIARILWKAGFRKVNL